jgi:hypothetical protein
MIIMWCGINENEKPVSQTILSEKQYNGVMKISNNVKMA